MRSMSDDEVTARLDGGTDASATRRVVGKAEHHRDVGCLGDPIEARLPVGNSRPGPFGRDEQRHRTGCFTDLSSNLINHSEAGVAPNRDAPQPPHQPSERPAK